MSANYIRLKAIRVKQGEPEVKWRIKYLFRSLSMMSHFPIAW